MRKLTEVFKVDRNPDKKSPQYRDVSSEELESFRTEIRILSLEPPRPSLRGVKVQNLNEVDLHFFKKFKNKKLTLGEIVQQRHILETLSTSANDSLQLLDYMEKQIRLESGY